MAAANAVAADDLDRPVGTSDVAEVDDVLAAMERMTTCSPRWSACGSRLNARSRSRWPPRRPGASAWRRSPTSSRPRSPSSRATPSSSPPTSRIVQGNAELLAADLEEGRLRGEQADEARAILDATHRLELLAADLEEGRLRGEQADEARAILDATHRLDAALIDIIAAWREDERDGEGRSEPDADSRG